MEDTTADSTINRIAFIGNYLPRQCGIATFTTDLCEAVAARHPGTTCIALPVNDVKTGYAYPARVRFELTEKDIESYRRAADFMNINNIDIVCLQHEYGIFGGRAGSHILALLRELRMPVVTTLHTILKNPDPDQRRVLEEVAALSDRLVVMSERGGSFLHEIYGVASDKIDFIPHGIPDVPFVDPSFHKDLFGVEGKIVLLSFGLLSANKGIETVISAMPAIATRYPNIVYIVLGATHPQVRQREGESYRLSLQWLAQEQGVEGHVVFYNRFVSLDELVKFISAADIYITPYLNEAQITSGTLAYTLGAGKAVISTPYWYAQELLADDRGVLVPFHHPAALAEQVIHLLENEAKRHAMRKRAYLYGRAMIWPRVAHKYMESFERARAERRHFSHPGFTAKALDKHQGELPPLKLDHLHHMTDATGMLQHAIFAVPNYREGYATDDNARALIVSVLLEVLEERDALELASRYLAFLWYAFDVETGRFHNFLDYQLAVTIYPSSDEGVITDIFGRINSGGKQLSPQEKRQAGMLDKFSDAIRKISSEIRGDSSEDLLNLSEMPEISIDSTREKIGYGLLAENIFWCKHGIIWKKQLRDSEDEESILDIVSSILRDEPIARSRELFNKIYDENSSEHKQLNTEIIKYGTDKLMHEIKVTFSMIENVFDSQNSRIVEIVNPKSSNPVKESFFAIFMAFFHLVVKEEKTPAEYDKIVQALNGLQKKMISTANYAVTADREKNINTTIGLIQKYFVKKDPPVLRHGAGLALDFENSIRRAKIESNRYECKQGFFDLSDSRKLNENLYTEIIETICGISNVGPDADGFLFIGVADKETDAQRIYYLDNIDYKTINQRYIVGIDRELHLLKGKMDDYVNKLLGKISGSELSEPLKSQVLSQFDIIEYKGLTIIRIRIPRQQNLSFIGNDSYIREYSKTIKLEGPKLIAASKLFGK